MSKTLIIAEKPSVAQDIVAVLDDQFVKEKTHYLGGKYIVSYAVGHLLTLCDPKDLNYKTWSLKNLPIILEEFPLKPIETAKSQLQALKKLILAKEVTQIINACDAGREGELIFRYIIDYVFKSKKIKKDKILNRLWLRSMTKPAIKEAFANLRSDEEMKNLEEAARSRSESDWLIGINASRGFTGYNSQFGGFFVTPCGRVQTPTLAMIVKREEERQQFKSQDYWLLEGIFSTIKNETYPGKWFDPNFKKPKDSSVEKQPNRYADRIWSKEQADQIVSKCVNQAATFTEKQKKTTQAAPLLYDLTTLQREANSRFGFSAKRTLGLLQTLYERHKVVTYPRTDSKYLPEDYLGRMREVFSSLAKGKFLTNFLQEALDKDYVKGSKKIFDNNKISDHHAIIPTGKIVSGLSEPEKKIYQIIVQRTLAIFFPAAQMMTTTRITVVKNEHFKTEGKILKVPGWKAIYSQTKNEEKFLAPISETEKLTTKAIEIEAKQTTPPARFTEASLLTAMEGAGKLLENEELQEAMKDRGLGTPATRATIIEKLLSDKYIVREEKALIPTSKAFNLFDLIYAMDIREFQDPVLTGEWQYKLALVEKGELTREAFMKGIVDYTCKIVENIKSYDEEVHKKEAEFSPLNGVKFYETLSRYLSADGKVVIRKVLGGKKMTPAEMKTLLTAKKIGPLEGFRSKKGNPFTASIVLTDENKVQFVFSNQEEIAEIPPESELVGNSPLDQSKVYQTMSFYISESYIEKKETGFKISRVILRKEISIENMQKMLKGEKTELIQGFRSTKSKRSFDAYLELDKTGKIVFSFPERKTKKKTSKKATKK